VVLTLFFKVFMPPQILHRYSVFVCFFLFCFFLNTDKKKICDSYKKRRPCVLSNISIWRFRLVCLLQLIILFPLAKQDFNNSVQFNAVASKAATHAVIADTPVMIYNFLLTVLSERNFRIFAN